LTFSQSPLLAINLLLSGISVYFYSFLWHLQTKAAANNVSSTSHGYMFCRWERVTFEPAFTSPRSQGSVSDDLDLRGRLDFVDNGAEIVTAARGPAWSAGNCEKRFSIAILRGYTDLDIHQETETDQRPLDNICCTPLSSQAALICILRWKTESHPRNTFDLGTTTPLSTLNKGLNLNSFHSLQIALETGS